jgi:hypothetical protein
MRYSIHDRATGKDHPLPSGTRADIVAHLLHIAPSKVRTCNRPGCGMPLVRGLSWHHWRANLRSHVCRECSNTEQAQRQRATRAAARFKKRTEGRPKVAEGTAHASP